MKWSYILLLISCASDISIMKHPSEPSGETGNTTSEPESQPGSEPDTNEPDSTMTELTVGFGDIHFRQIACPACVGEPGEFDITAELKLHYPTSGDYTSWLTPVGTCTTSLIETHVSNQPLATTQPASFNSIVLNPSGQGTWANSYLYEYQYERNTSYTVTSEHSTIVNAFQTLEGFDFIEPYTLLWVDPSYAFEAVISKSGTGFSWAPAVPNSTFEIMVAVYSPDGAQLLGVVSCMENDVGYMFVPGTYFQSYPTWSLASVHLTRHRTARVAVPELNGYFESHMRWSVNGTGHVE